MVCVTTRKRMTTRFTLAIALLTLAALLGACAAPTGPASGQSAAQPATQSAAPTQAPQEAPAATTAPVAQAPAATEAPAQTPAAAAGVSFSKDVMPVFEKSCIKCHGGSDGTKGDLSLKTYDDTMKGGKDGAAINPGDAAGSLLVKQIQNGKMPKRGQKLPQDQIDLVAKWVTEGAQNN